MLRYWRSTGLVTLIALSDLLALLGGIPLYVLEGLYWIRNVDHGVVGLWTGNHESSKIPILWGLRILTIGKLILILNICRTLVQFHVERYGVREISNGRVMLLMLMAAWHLLISAMQLGSFYVGWIWKEEWMRIGPAPIIASITVFCEGILMAVTVYYRKRQTLWNQFSKDIGMYF